MEQVHQNTILSISPITLKVTGRLVDLEIKITVPLQGGGFPVILFSHGGGNSNFLTSYKGGGPLVDYWASQGFAVIQPTHLSSKTLDLPPTTTGFPIYAKSRVEDFTEILNQLHKIESEYPILIGKFDKERIAVAGHSGGGLTAAMLIGAYYTDDNGTEMYMPDNRIKTGILMATSGEGDDHMPAPWGKLDIVRTFRYDKMLTPALVVAGDKDVSPISSKGEKYHMDAYYQSPGKKDLLILIDGKHMLGGVTGYDAAETTDENPERVAIIQKMTTAYLRSFFSPQDNSWKNESKKLNEIQNRQATIISK
ncbi:hypothetical protein [Chryseobacterium sp. ISL-6]|uniref:alpha/beta hydrolase family protein n=1 Tax=Chryseobacterium sp. ISL-6 TaxID=2819143 RepID=UPI001BE82A9F|nr:hypothetical protein [Chryseobacterium sp. ISL-6]MBT2622658.1 hypothetical protein [Chryseobacterium sp. ISL-6]